MTQECNFTEPDLRLWRVLRSSDAGSCIDPPPRAARKVAENLREPSEGFSMRAWPRSNGDVRRPNGSATTYVENCTLSGSHKNRPRRSERSRRGQESPGPTPHALRGRTEALVA